MSRVDFVPEEYMQQRQSGKANFMYLLLFGAMMCGIGVTFSIIKVRQKAVAAELATVNAKMVQAGAQIAQLEELKTKGKDVMKTMVMTSGLIEKVPRSIILACLTNNMPTGVSLLELKLEEKVITPKVPKPVAKTAGAAAAAAAAPPKKIVSTMVNISGIAPSDIGVANYIARLSESILLDRVSLVESKERKIDDMKFRQFKLNAYIKSEMLLTKEDISNIRRKRQETM
jgi:Tfp pilus assembly protein PilN